MRNCFVRLIIRGYIHRIKGLISVILSYRFGNLKTIVASLPSLHILPSRPECTYCKQGPTPMRQAQSILDGSFSSEHSNKHSNDFAVTTSFKEAFWEQSGRASKGAGANSIKVYQARSQRCLSPYCLLHGAQSLTINAVQM